MKDFFVRFLVICLSLSFVFMLSNTTYAELQSILLMTGSTGIEVEKVQNQLENLGYSIKKDRKGVYGHYTAVAVRCFQKDYGYKTTGVVNKEIYDALFSQEGGVKSTTSSSESDYSGVVTSSALFIILCGVIAKSKSKRRRILYKTRQRIEKPQSVNQERKIYVEEMTGIQFEHFCASLLQNQYGFVEVKYTKVSNDYGADLVAWDKKGIKWVVQCKRYNKHVGNSAVQEIVAARAHYGANCTCIMTNSVLTENARNLAETNSVYIIENIQGYFLYDE